MSLSLGRSTTDADEVSLCDAGLPFFLKALFNDDLKLFIVIVASRRYGAVKMEHEGDENGWV